jgi:hypothetical protein
MAVQVLHAAGLAPLGREGRFRHGLRQLHSSGVGQEVPSLLAQRPHQQRTLIGAQSVGDQAVHMREEQRRGLLGSVAGQWSFACRCWLALHFIHG